MNDNSMIINNILIRDILCNINIQNTSKIIKFYLYCYSYKDNNNIFIDTENIILDNLQLSKNDVDNILLYLLEAQLIKIFNTNPIHFEFINIDQSTLEKSYNSIYNHIKYSFYQEINKKMQNLFHNKLIPYREYEKLDYFLKNENNVNVDMLLLIAQYCSQNNDNNSNISYVVKTYNKLNEIGCLNADYIKIYCEPNIKKIKTIISKLNYRCIINDDIINKYNNLTNILNFKFEIILYAATKLPKQKFDDLNIFLNQLYYNYQSLDKNEYNNIDDYYYNMVDTYCESYSIMNKLSILYIDKELFLKIYYIKWKKMQFNYESLCLIADYCFRINKMSCEYMNNVVYYLYNKNIKNKNDIQNLLLENNDVLDQQFNNDAFKLETQEAENYEIANNIKGFSELFAKLKRINLLKCQSYSINNNDYLKYSQEQKKLVKKINKLLSENSKLTLKDLGCELS